jgi:hypothetical protein
MSTQYRLVQSRETASGGCSAGQGSSELQRHGFIFNPSDVQNTYVSNTTQPPTVFNIFLFLF